MKTALRLPARIGLALIIAGALILVAQIALLASSRPRLEQRGKVLAGDEAMVGEQNIRPALSVLGVACLAGGLFAYALGSGPKAS